MKIGQLCVKLAGRDANKLCVVVDVLDGNFVLIDGNTRRRKCNMNHLELLPNVLSIAKQASHDDVVDAMKEAGIRVVERKISEKKGRVKGERPVMKRKAVLKHGQEKKESEKAAKEKTDE